MASRSLRTRVVGTEHRVAPLERLRAPLNAEHLSVVPLAGAVTAVGTGTRHGWTIAAMCLSIAYLMVYVTARRCG